MLPLTCLVYLLTAKISQFIPENAPNDPRMTEIGHAFSFLVLQMILTVQSTLLNWTLVRLLLSRHSLEVYLESPFQFFRNLASLLVRSCKAQVMRKRDQQRLPEELVMIPGPRLQSRPGEGWGSADE